MGTASDISRSGPAGTFNLRVAAVITKQSLEQEIGRYAPARRPDPAVTPAGLLVATRSAQPQR